MIEALKSLAAQGAALGRAIGILGREQAGTAKGLTSELGDFRAEMRKTLNRMERQQTLVLKQSQAIGLRVGVTEEELRKMKQEIDDLTAEMLLERASTERQARNGNGDAE